MPIIEPEVDEITTEDTRRALRFYQFLRAIARDFGFSDPSVWHNSDASDLDREYIDADAKKRIVEAYLSIPGNSLDDVVAFEKGYLDRGITDKSPSADPKWDDLADRYPALRKFFDKPLELPDDRIVTQADSLDIYLQTQRENDKPGPIQAHECRIGITKLAVPPIAINVTQTFKQNILSNRALRS